MNFKQMINKNKKSVLIQTILAYIVTLIAMSGIFCVGMLALHILYGYIAPSLGFPILNIFHFTGTFAFANIIAYIMGIYFKADVRINYPGTSNALSQVSTTSVDQFLKDLEEGIE